MPLYLYRCPEGHQLERLQAQGVETLACGCGALAQRCAVNVLTVVGKATIPPSERSYRQAYAEYREAVEDVAYHYDKVNRDRAPDEQVKERDYYQEASAQAQAKGAKICC